MDEVFGGSYCMENNSIFEFFWMVPTNVQHAGLSIATS